MKPDYTRAPISHLTSKVLKDVQRVFEAALRRDPPERAQFVAEATVGAPDIRNEVHALLNVWDEYNSTFIVPAPPPGGGLAPGSLVGPYLIRHELGRGGMGIVYLAEDTRLSRRVALKAIHPDRTAGIEQRERLQREARTAATLSHPGIATVYAFEEIEGTHYIASEFVPGRTVRAMLEGGPLAPATVMEVATHIARVLAAVHAQGLVHRDLKPENVMTTPSGVVKLLDFGVALSESVAVTRLTQPGTVVGTPAYMAPEQLLEQPLDFRVDVFSFGVLLYEMASGTNPFEAKTLPATINNVLQLQPPRLAVKGPQARELARIIDLCLSKRPDDRYRSTDALVADLDQLHRRSGDPIQPRRELVDPPRAQKTVTSKWWWEFHQIIVSAVYVVMMYPAWLARTWLPRPWGMAFFFAILACAAAGTTLRENLRFSSRKYPGEFQAQRVRAAPWIRACDIGFAASLLVAAMGIGSDHPVIGTIFVTIAIVSLVAALVIEPTTAKAAFRRKSGTVRTVKSGS